MRDSNLDLIAFLQFQGIDNCRGQAYGQAVSPFRDLHESFLFWIYRCNCISIHLGCATVRVFRNEVELRSAAEVGYPHIYFTDAIGECQRRITA